MIISTLLISQQIQYMFEKDKGFDENAVVLLDITHGEISEKIFRY